MSTPFYLRKFTADPDDINIIFSTDSYDTLNIHRSWDSQSQSTSRTLSEFDRAILVARPAMPASAAAPPASAQATAVPRTPETSQPQSTPVPVPRPLLTVDELWLLCRDACVELDARRHCMPAVMRVIVANARFMSVSKCGSVALSAVYVRAGPVDKQLIANAVLPVFFVLAMDTFGNYIVQRIIEWSDRMTAARYIVTHFSGRLLQMSCSKYASNVVQTATRVCGEVTEVVHRCLNELVFNRHALCTLVHDKYGNFVLQSVLSILPDLDELDHAARVLHPLLEDSPYSTNIYAKLSARRHLLMRPLLERHRLGFRVCFPNAEVRQIGDLEEFEVVSEEGVQVTSFTVQGSDAAPPPAAPSVPMVAPPRSMYDTTTVTTMRAYRYRRPPHNSSFSSAETAAVFGPSRLLEPASPYLATRPGSAVEIPLTLPYPTISQNAQG